MNLFSGPTCSHIESLSDVHVEFSKLITGVVSACLTPDFSSDKAATNITIRSTEDGIRIPNSRFITLRSDNAPLAVAEIRVFGECPTSYCGPNCTDFCFCETPLLGQEQLQGTPCRGGCLTGSARGATYEIVVTKHLVLTVGMPVTAMISVIPGQGNVLDSTKDVH